MRKRIVNDTKYVWVLAAAIVLFTHCTKSPPFQDTDPTTGLPPVALTTTGGECSIIKIAQKNSGSGADNAFEISRNATTLISQSLRSYDSLAKKLDYNIAVVATGDTLKLSTGESFILNATTKLVEYFYTRSDLSDPTSDKLVFKYEYNVSGYLVKKLQYINNATAAFYETNYTYQNNILTNVTVLAGSKKDKLLQSTLEYDMTTERKSWIYLFTDFFEGYNYLQAFNFGKKGTYPVKNIVTNVYDITDGSVLDTWSTAFSGYVFSQDGFILQTTAKGDLQQGLGLLFGTTRFDYLCNK